MIRLIRKYGWENSDTRLIRKCVKNNNRCMIIRTFILVIILIAVTTPPTMAEMEIETRTTVQLRLCGEADAGAIFGGRVQTCVIYDTFARESEVFVRVCGGLRIGAGLDMVIGGSVKGSLLACPQVSVKFSRMTPSLETVLKLLQDDESEVTKKIYKDLEKTLRRQLRELDDEQLKELGIDRDELNKIKFKGFTTFVDRTEDANVAKEVESLPLVVEWQPVG